MNYISFLFNGFLQKYNLQEAFVYNGFKRKWFEEFHKYWINILDGRPLTIMDFFMLLYDYRKKQQYLSELDWHSPETHINNWQNPNQIYVTFSSIRKLALRPISGVKLWKLIKKGSIILEYGCSLAPYYYCYRNFFSHLDCEWFLADIPNFPFHFARYLYRNDKEVECVMIESTDFLNPLKDINTYDVVILSNVLEHLDNPVFVSNYLLERLNDGGLFVFDYIITEGKGLDHPQALAMREECLKIILERTEIIYGNVDISNNVGFSIGKKRPNKHE